jgi:hypothetical protein
LEIKRQINPSDRIATLNRLADAFERRCYDAVIVYGEKSKSELRHKTFFFSEENHQRVYSGGLLHHYVMESYERGLKLPPFFGQVVMPRMW